MLQIFVAFLLCSMNRNSPFVDRVAKVLVAISHHHRIVDFDPREESPGPLLTNGNVMCASPTWNGSMSVSVPGYQPPFYFFPSLVSLIFD